MTKQLQNVNLLYNTLLENIGCWKKFSAYISTKWINRFDYLDEFSTKNGTADTPEKLLQLIQERRRKPPTDYVFYIRTTIDIHRLRQYITSLLRRYTIPILPRPTSYSIQWSYINTRHR